MTFSSHVENVGLPGGNRSIVRGTVRVKSKHHPQFLVPLAGKGHAHCALSLVYALGKLVDVCSAGFWEGLSFTGTEAAKGRTAEPASPHKEEEITINGSFD